MADLFRLSDDQWAVMVPFILKDRPGQERKDGRLIISGILHVLTSCSRCVTAPSLIRAAHRPSRSMVLAEGMGGWLWSGAEACRRRSWPSLASWRSCCLAYGATRRTSLVDRSRDGGLKLTDQYHVTLSSPAWSRSLWGRRELGRPRKLERRFCRARA
jgi:hypothetical protein